jgi:hypothetical protein
MSAVYGALGSNANVKGPFNSINFLTIFKSYPTSSIIIASFGRTGEECSSPVGSIGIDGGVSCLGNISYVGLLRWASDGTLLVAIGDGSSLIGGFKSKLWARTMAIRTKEIKLAMPINALVSWALY